MNHKIYRAVTTVCLTLPVCLLIVGCKGKVNTTADAPAGAAPESKAMTADADNSAKNVRDRDEAALTPGDQSNTPADRDITQRVRKTLVSGPTDYSTTAKNIKIVTINGKVTLRGPVNSEAEKSGIVNIARTVAGDGNVDDQLEVKANP